MVALERIDSRPCAARRARRDPGLEKAVRSYGPHTFSWTRTTCWLFFFLTIFGHTPTDIRLVDGIKIVDMDLVRFDLHD